MSSIWAPELGEAVSCLSALNRVEIPINFVRELIGRDDYNGHIRQLFPDNSLRRNEEGHYACHSEIATS